MLALRRHFRQSGSHAGPLPEIPVTVIARPLRSRQVVGWAITAGVAVIFIAFGLDTLASPSGGDIALCIAGLGLLFVCISEATERAIIGESGISISRPPRRTLRVAATDMTRLIRNTDAQWLVHVAGRRRPLNLMLLAYNSDELNSAMLGLAERHGIAVVESDIFREVDRA